MRKGHPHTLLVGMQTGAATRENSMEISQKIKNRNTIHSSYATTGYLSKETEINNSKRFMHPCVHCGIIHNRQAVEAIQVPCYRRTDKENVVCIIYNGILLSPTMGWGFLQVYLASQSRHHLCWENILELNEMENACECVSLFLTKLFRHRKIKGAVS